MGFCTSVENKSTEKALLTTSNLFERLARVDGYVSSTCDYKVALFLDNVSSLVNFKNITNLQAMEAI